MTINYNTDPGAERRIDITPEAEVESVGASTKFRTDKYLDGDEVRGRLDRVQQWFREEVEWQAEERAERLKDHEYYDGYQWSEEDAAELKKRGQEAFVFNMIKESVDVLSGSQRQAKIDYRILPRTKNDRKLAEVKTKGFKFISDVNHLFVHRSWASKDQIISGLGWVDTGVRTDPDDEPIYYQYEDWRNCWYDHLAQGPDYMKAGRFVFRAKWVDLDVAVSMFPGRAGQLMQSVASGTGMDNLPNWVDDRVFPFGGEDDDVATNVTNISGAIGKRNRVLMIECQYKLPKQSVKVLKGEGIGSLHNTFYDPKDPVDAIESLISSGHASLVDAKKTVMRQMIFVNNYAMQDIVTPYNHNRFSLVPLFAFRRKKTGAPYGLVRNLRNPQEDLNKRRSKALYHLATNKVIADDDATDDWDTLYDEAQRPDGLIKKRRGSEVSINNEGGIGMEHVQLAEQDLKYIERASGITDEARGVQTNAISGTAIEARQQSSQTATSEYRENRQLFDQQAGQNVLSLMEQFWNEPKTLRLVGDEGGIEFFDINQETEEGLVENDITSTQADFIVDTTPFTVTQRQAAWQAIGGIIKDMPEQIQLSLLDIWAELSDLPGLSTVGAQRIRKITGQDDPSADPDSEEAQAEEMAKQEAADKQAQLEEQMINLEMAMKEAKALRDKAQGEKTLKELEHVDAKIDEIYAKIQAMREKSEDSGKLVNIKKAETLHKIEESEKQPVKPKEAANGR